MMLEHGGNIWLHPDMLDFSANINPLGMPEAVRTAIAGAASACVHYPDPYCTALTDAIAQVEQLSSEQIVCGSGAADLIYRIVYALRPQKALLCAPTFSEYRKALREISCRCTEYPLLESENFLLDRKILEALTAETDLVFLCTPNNPTGRCIKPELLRQIAEVCRQRRITLVCDECFLEFAENASAYSLKSVLHEGCIILKAFTKLYAVPGIRLGYVICGSRDTADCIRNTGQYWSVSIPAQSAGIAALKLVDYPEKTAAYIAHERRHLTASLRQCGMKVYDSEANFLLVKAPSDFAEAMYRAKILIRRCTNFSGLDETYFRIAVRTEEENAVLIAAAERYLHG